METSIPYIVGTSGIVIAILFGIIAYWFKDLLNKVGQITSIIKDIEYLKEKFQEIKAPIEKIERLDREMGIVQRDLKTAFIRVDEIRESHRHLIREVYRHKEDDDD